MAVSRKELYEEVWTEPMTTVANRYDMSSNFLARAGEQLNIPRLSRGYWAPLKAGQKLWKPPLAAQRAGDVLEWSRDGERADSLRAGTRHPVAQASEVGTVGATSSPRVAIRENFEAGRVSREAPQAVQARDCRYLRLEGDAEARARRGRWPGRENWRTAATMSSFNLPTRTTTVPQSISGPRARA